MEIAFRGTHKVVADILGILYALCIFSRKKQKAQQPRIVGSFCMKNVEEKKKPKELKCYQCNAFIKVPDDYIGNPYHILEVHYMVVHQIDLRTVNWNKPKRIVEIDG